MNNFSDVICSPDELEVKIGDYIRSGDKDCHLAWLDNRTPLNSWAKIIDIEYPYFRTDKDGDRWWNFVSWKFGRKEKVGFCKHDEHISGELFNSKIGNLLY